MNDIEILELLSRKIEEQNSIITCCSSIINKKAEAKERTEYIEIKRFVENLLKERQEDKELIQHLRSHSDYETICAENNYLEEQIEIIEYSLKDLEQIEKEHKEENGRLRKELDKKENTINLMAEQLTTPVHSKKWVIEYFTNKVEEDK